MISPGINVKDSKNALDIGICIMNPIIIVPTISNPKTPIMKVTINKTKKFIFPK